MLFDDPLSVEFNELAQRIKEETLALLPNNTKKTKAVRAPKQPRQKFYMSKELRARLHELLKRQLEDNVVSTICKRLLSLKLISLDSVNYLGLSNDDYSKISYLTPERYERVKGQTFIEKHITRKTRVVINTFINEYVLKNDGTRESRRRDKQVISHFKREDVEKNNQKTLKLDRIKIYNEEESNKQGVPVYDFNYKMEKSIDVRYYLTPYYGYQFHSGILFDSTGNEMDDWFFLDLTEKTIESVWDYTLRYHQSIHKILTKLFGNEFSEREKNIFAEHYFKMVIPNKKGIEFDVVDGEYLKYYYLEDNYKKPVNNSTLWQSCMRYSNTQKFLDFYLNVPGTKLAVLKEQGKVIARSLLWYIDGKVYYDRIYSYNQEALAFMENYLNSVGFDTVRDDHGSGIQAKQYLRIDLSYDQFTKSDYYPYADSLRYYYPDKQVLSNEVFSGETRHTLERTDGTYDTWPEEDIDEYSCDECDFTSNDPDDLSSVERGPGRGACVCGECGVYSDVYQEVILRENSSYCEYSQSYILDEDLVRLRSGDYCYDQHEDLAQYENDYGYFILTEDDFVELTGLYYHPEDPALVQEQTQNQEEEQEEQEENNII